MFQEQVCQAIKKHESKRAQARQQWMTEYQIKCERHFAKKEQEANNFFACIDNSFQNVLAQQKARDRQGFCDLQRKILYALESGKTSVKLFQVPRNPNFWQWHFLGQKWSLKDMRAPNSTRCCENEIHKQYHAKFKNLIARFKHDTIAEHFNNQYGDAFKEVIGMDVAIDLSFWTFGDISFLLSFSQFDKRRTGKKVDEKSVCIAETTKKQIYLKDKIN